jgi:hypothetical protein
MAINAFKKLLHYLTSWSLRETAIGVTPVPKKSLKEMDESYLFK